MSNVAIDIQDLWKQYRVGQKKSTSFRESMMRAFTRDESDYFWALKEINFQVKHGEAVGIIGKNGAGKSTLLKILSKITYPTRGRVEMKGRVSSLLEVGTGFHMELTGRQNIYLNGTLLGMTRREIAARFDEIVAFSGVEKFIDTPVKHYSSGMKVRLAFSVAAHLEPEILIIDEVLAVGDAEFQKKCLGKMEDVAGEGRTVLFVSHNMGAVESLCKTGVLLENGEVTLISNTKRVVDIYLAGEASEIEKRVDLNHIPRKVKPGLMKFSEVEFEKPQLSFGEDIVFKIKIDQIGLVQSFHNIEIAFSINNSKGITIIHGCNYFTRTNLQMENASEYIQVKCQNNLRPDRYNLTFFLRVNGIIQDWLSNACTIEINDGNPYGHTNTSEIQGVVFPYYTIGKVFHA